MSRYIYYLIILVRLLLLAISCYGYVQQLSKQVRLEFSMGILLSGIGSVMFLAGIFHVLREAAWLVFAGGIWLAVLSVKKQNHVEWFRCPQNGDTFMPSLIFFAAMAIFFLGQMFQSEFIHFDNFSHWGVAAKIVSQKDMFPNTADTNLSFNSYPLGSAAFIYYITEIAGTSQEWLQMWAQAILMVGMLTSLFAFGKGLACVFTTCAGVVMLLCGNTGLVDLLVDTLLPVVAIGAAAFCVYNKNELERKIWFVIPYVIFLVSIKNSGILFAALILAYVFFSVPKTKDNLKTWLIAAISPLTAIFLWNRHVEQIFDEGTLSKHAMRMDNYQQVLAEKSPEDLLAILEAFGNSMRQSAIPVLYLLLLGILLLAYRKYVSKKNCRELGTELIFAGLSYLLYQLGTLGMYILSMPIAEALMMAGYDRYHKTILVFSAGIVLIAAIREIRDSNDHMLGKICAALLAAGTIVMSAMALQPNFQYYSRQTLENTERAKFDRLISDYGLRSHDSYLILVDEKRKDYGYLYYMAQYLLAPENVTLETVSSVDELENKEFNFVIMFDDTEINRQYLLDQFGLDEEVGYIGGKPLS